MMEALAKLSEDPANAVVSMNSACLRLDWVIELDITVCGRFGHCWNEGSRGQCEDCLLYTSDAADE